MKKAKFYLLVIIIVVIVAIIVIIAIRYNRTNSELLVIDQEQITSIVVRNGSTGESITIKETEEIINKINNLELAKCGEVSDTDGWCFTLDFLNGNIEEDIFARYTLKNDYEIEYEDYVYGNGEHTGLIEYFEEMFN